MRRKDVLAVAPHGLDEVLGCGGCIALHALAVASVHPLILFGDGTGRDEARREAAAKAAEILGSAPPRFVGLPENLSDTIPLVDIVAIVEQAIRDHRPGTVYVSHGGNLNIDHQTVYRATVTAARPVRVLPVQEIYAYEVPSSTDWAAQGIGPAFRPNHFVEVTRVVERKLAALAAYGAELPDAPHARSLSAIKALMQSRGESVGVEAAEAFMLVRSVVRA